MLPLDVDDDGIAVYLCHVNFSGDRQLHSTTPDTRPRIHAHLTNAPNYHHAYRTILPFTISQVELDVAALVYPNSIMMTFGKIDFAAGCSRNSIYQHPPGSEQI